ncbi:MAG: hypothetical protein Q4D80_04945 [Pseudomonadota bacterium]|nr:hypothetical protein [Pseudomonadota bacterium]
MKLSKCLTVKVFCLIATIMCASKATKAAEILPLSVKETPVSSENIQLAANNPKAFKDCCAFNESLC